MKEFAHYGDVDDPLSFPFIVVGNKVDLGDTSRQVSADECSQWLNYHGNPPYFETSAKTDINISQVFEESVQQWIKRENVLDAQMKATTNTLLLTDRNSETDRSSCC